MLKKSLFSLGCMVLLYAVAASLGLAGSAVAETPSKSGERLLSIHDGNLDRGILTRATTIRQAFEEAGIPFDTNDIVEPSLDETLVASNYDVNIYRARPVTIVDGSVRKKIMSAYRTPAQIVAHAGMELHDEDLTFTSLPDNIASGGAAMQLTIERATPFTLVLYGKKTTAYTRSTTVADMLKEKDIKIGNQDTLSVDVNSQVVAGMVIELWRNGVQTVTLDEEVPFGIDRIQDVDREVGYREIKTPGVPGKRTVTYEIEMKNGEEVSRKEIQSVTTKEPIKQVEVVGAKPSFSGDFAAALAKLRSCEGGYNSWNPAGPYYGAYQFDRRTWEGVTDAPYGNATPAEQDEAARRLYLKRGWQPWPVCGASLPDVYR